MRLLLDTHSMYWFIGDRVGGVLNQGPPTAPLDRVETGGAIGQQT